MEDIINRIKTELEISLDKTNSAEKFVVAVYLFGSTVRPETIKKESDVDLAFLLDAGSYSSDPLKTTAPAYLAAAALGMSLGLQTDVTILNAASLEIAHEAVTTGTCLIDNDPDRRLNYETALRGLYFDFRPFLEKLRDNCANRLQLSTK